MKLKQSYFLLFFFGLIFFANQIQAAPPANDNLANFQTISGSNGTITANNIDATRQSLEPAHDFQRLVYRTVWFDWTATETKPVVFEIESADFDAAMGVYLGGNFFPLSTFTLNNDSNGNRPRLELGATAGQHYKIVVGLYAETEQQGGNFTLNWTTRDKPTNDNFADAFTIPNATKGSIVSTVENATKETGEPVHIAGNKSVWFSYTNTTPNDLSITFSTQFFSTPFFPSPDATLAVYTGSAVNNLTAIVKNDNTSAQNTSRVTFLAKTGVTYRIAIDEGFSPANTTAMLNWEITKLKGYTDFGFKFSQTAETVNDDAVDISVFRPSNGVWYWINSANFTFNAFQFGANGDTPVPTDYDGDARSDIAVTRNENGLKYWWIRSSFDGSYKVVQWGLSTDKVVPGDYDFDGRADIAVFRGKNGAGIWYILRSSDGQAYVKEFGYSDDIPVIGDFKGTGGGSDLAVFRPSNGTFYVYDGVNTIYIPFGQNGDKPVVGDYDFDGKSDVAVYRPSDSTWYILKSRNNEVQYQQWGLPDDIPLPGDYDNNSNDEYDFAVFRPSEGMWYILKASATQNQFTPYGLSSDIPVTSLSAIIQSN